MYSVQEESLSPLLSSSRHNGIQELFAKLLLSLRDIGIVCDRRDVNNLIASGWYGILGALRLGIKGLKKSVEVAG